MANSTNNAAQQTLKVHHYIRTLFSSLFGFIAVALIMVSILVVWLGRTLTNTGQYVKTVAPLVTKPDIQNFIITKTTDQLLDKSDSPVLDIAGKLLTPDQIAGKTDAQLKDQVKPIITDSLHTVLSSAAFATLWKDTNTSVHASLISQLNAKADTINLDFHPLVAGTIDQLAATKLTFVKENLKIADDAGKVTLQSKQSQNVAKVYDYFKKAMLAIVAVAVLASVLCILISVHHIKTFRRVALTVGIFSAILAGVLSATSLFKISKDDVVQQKFAVALINGVTHDLRLTLIVIAVAGIGGSIGSKIYTVMMSKKSQPRKK